MFVDLKFLVHVKSSILINFLKVTFGRGEEWESEKKRERERNSGQKDINYFSIFPVATGISSQGQNKASPAEEGQNSCSAFHKRELPKSHSHLYSGWRYASLSITMLQQVF